MLVVGKSDNHKASKKAIYWRCLCDCGNEKIATSYELRSGKAKQCSFCAKKQSGLTRKIAIIGKKYGKLKVLDLFSDINNESKSKTLYKCLCDCGKVTVKSREYLTSKKSTPIKSCGCERAKNIEKSIKNVIGQQYGKLLVIDDYHTKDGRMLLCECRCGNIIARKKTDITSGHTKSCGCLQKEMASTKNTKNWQGYTSKYGISFIEPAYKNNNGKWFWKCRCFCGNEFVALPAKIASGHTSSCGCKNTPSKERLIKAILDDHNINYIHQYSTDKCKYKYPLKFDFALLKDDNTPYCFIEYDGEQHYKPINFFGGIAGFEKALKRDEIKNTYCKEKGIPLYRLKYDLTDNEIKEKIVNIIYP